MTRQNVRCAVYTRKSSEEGLEQSFNSLEAQREACDAYILSQKHEGWTVINRRYDDGGFSGGTTDRPALKQLLNDVQAGRLDTIVVYKVDRLTRSLADFAKIIEILDSRAVSFVSVTQQFNTTTSMGRLTLNVLLSFAQFEREITAERIRDKIAASKKKGMWMGGTVPLGYDCVDRQLIVNQGEAETVRKIFRKYLSLASVRKLKEFLDQRQIRSKIRTSVVGRTHGGTAYSRGALYHLLNNHIYIGEVVHQGHAYTGQHQSIVPRQLWNRVAASLQQNNQAHRTGKSQSTPSLLTGRVFDSNGVRYTPTHAVKNAKRYRYYTSQTTVQGAGIKPTITRFPANALEQFVKSQIQSLLQASAKCTARMKDGPSKETAANRAMDLAEKWPKLEISKQHEFVRTVLRRVTVSQTRVWIEIDNTRLVATLLGQNPEAQLTPSSNKIDILKLAGDFQILRRGGELRVIAPYGESCFERKSVPSITKAIARAYDWHQRIIAGGISSISELVRKSGFTQPYVRRVLKCAYLSPQIVEALLTGQHQPNLTLKEIIAHVPLNWLEQVQVGYTCVLQTPSARPLREQSEHEQFATAESI